MVVAKIAGEGARKDVRHGAGRGEQGKRRLFGSEDYRGTIFRFPNVEARSRCASQIAIAMLQLAQNERWRLGYTPRGE